MAKAQWRWVRRGVRRMVRGARTWSTPFGEHPGDHVRVERAADAPPGYQPNISVIYQRPPDICFISLVSRLIRYQADNPADIALPDIYRG